MIYWAESVRRSYLREGGDKSFIMETCKKLCNPKIWRVAHFLIIFRIILSLLDTATDFYTMYRYSSIKKGLMQSAFIGILVSLILHNVISCVHGLFNLSKFHGRKNTIIWKNGWWKGVVLVTHFIGLGNIMLPLDTLLYAKNTDESQLNIRFVIMLLIL